jgi:hypothetical protein
MGMGTNTFLQSLAANRNLQNCIAKMLHHAPDAREQYN